MEVVFTGFCSAIRGDVRLVSTTYLWMFPIYGMGIVLEPVHNSIRGQMWPVRGLIYAGVIFALEYVSGLMIRQLTGVCPWNYTGMYAVQGLIRLDFLPIWFCVGLIFERTHDFLVRLDATMFTR
ncbi:MAG: hypothetical protein FWG69_03105 [Oscillospiraceae bacterium]|nr:hypothetical protein [Oscillospiraceae bacterium]